MSTAAFILPDPAAVPEFLAPRIEVVRRTLHAGQPEEALRLSRIISEELAGSYGSGHHYTLHALELVAFCAQLAGYPALATEVAVHTAAAWQRVLDAGHQVRRQAVNGAASWLTVTNAPDAVRSGTDLLALLQSVYGRGHSLTRFVGRRLDAITGADREAAASALRASGPALLTRP